MTNKKVEKQGKNKKIGIICLAVSAVIVVGYLCLCMIAGGNDFIGTTLINGVDVSEMTKQEAIAALNNKYVKDDVKTVSLSVNNDKQFTLNTENALSFDATTTVDEIYSKQHSSFFNQGMLLFSNNNYSVPVTVKDQSVLETAIKESGILDYDTSVATTYNILDDAVEFVKGKEGVKVTLETVVKDVTDALTQYKVNEAVICTLTKSGIAEDEMTKIHTELNKECVNATLDKNNGYAIVPSQVGIYYSLDDAKKAFDGVQDGETFKVAATVTQPKVTTELLEKNLFKDVLGSYTTTVSGIESRRHNVKLSGSKCNGTILLPGEVFSYNGVVGKRTAAAGFGVGAAYVDGEVVEAIGGGICQTSSTIYNAAMLANLQIVERKAHSYVSSYVPIGRDATVSWGGPDFKFKNNTDYPIKIVASYVNHKQTIKIYGTDLENITVKITSTQLSSTPYQTVTKEDPTMDEGQTKVTQSGSTGATAQSYRYVYKNGTLISSSKEAYSSYKTRNEIVYVGTKPVETPPATDTTTPEGDAGTTTPTTPNTDSSTTTQSNEQNVTQ